MQPLTEPNAVASSNGAPPPPMHILVLADRDWTHPQGGGTGVNLLGHVRHWLDWGHTVTVVAGSFPGAVAEERTDRLTVYRRGGRKGVFPHALWRVRRDLAQDADVVLEIINGISFLTPLWLRLPHVAYVHHVHHDQYLIEMGLMGRVAAFWAETVPLRRLYRRRRFVTVSCATADQLCDLGVPRHAIDVSYTGPDPGTYTAGPGARAPEPTLLYLGRLKRYKRIELLLDTLEEIDNAVLEIAGDGDQRSVLEAEIARRGLGDRVRLHGFVDEDTKLALLRKAWLLVTASSVEGWGLTALEAAACGTPTVAIAVGGLKEAVEDGRTGLLAADPAELTACVHRLLSDRDLRERLGDNARRRAGELSWRESAAHLVAVMQQECGRMAPQATARSTGLTSPVAAGPLTAQWISPAPEVRDHS